MRILLMLLMCAACMAAPAQQVRVEQRQRVLPWLEEPAYRPVLNATGDKLLFTDADASHLKLYDFTTGDVVTVSDEPGSGGDAFFEGDERVYYVTSRRDERNLVFRTGHCYDLKSKAGRVVLPPQHGAVHAVKAISGAGLKSDAGLYRAAATSRAAVYTQDCEVVVLTGRTERRFTPIAGSAGYLWPSLSPDGQRIAFVAAGHGIVIIDLNGKILAQLGNYEMPSWLNDDYVVAQHATDDGHQFTSSQIVLLKADGTWSTALTSPSSMTMQPTAANGRVVYTSIDGKLYRMDLNIE